MAKQARTPEARDVQRLHAAFTQLEFDLHVAHAVLFQCDGLRTMAPAGAELFHEEVDFILKEIEGWRALITEFVGDFRLMNGKEWQRDKEDSPNAKSSFVAGSTEHIKHEEASQTLHSELAGGAVIGRLQMIAVAELLGNTTPLPQHNLCLPIPEAGLVPYELQPAALTGANIEDRRLWQGDFDSDDSWSECPVADPPSANHSGVPGENTQDCVPPAQPAAVATPAGLAGVAAGESHCSPTELYIDIGDGSLVTIPGRHNDIWDRWALPSLAPRPSAASDSSGGSAGTPQARQIGIKSACPYSEQHQWHDQGPDHMHEGCKFVVGDLPSWTKPAHVPSGSICFADQDRFARIKSAGHRTRVPQPRSHARTLTHAPLQRLAPSTAMLRGAGSHHGA